MLKAPKIFLRVRVSKGAICNLSFSEDGGESFVAREGRWIGARIGSFFTRPGKTNDAGTADVDWIRFER
jgi:hypothetical protein